MSESKEKLWLVKVLLGKKENDEVMKGGGRSTRKNIWKELKDKLRNGMKTRYEIEGEGKGWRCWKEKKKII